MAVIHGLEDPEVQAKVEKMNSDYFDPRIDRNMFRPPDRMIHIFSVSPRSFIVDRAPLWVKLHLRGCTKGERFVPVAHIPDPLQQSVHSTENGRRRAEAHDGLRVAIDLINPNNPTNDPDWTPSAEMSAFFSTSKGCDLFSQGLFISLKEEPTDREIVRAEERRNRRWRSLISHADSLEGTNRQELEELLRGEDGVDLRLALNFYGEQRAYHKPMIAMQTCPNCGDSVKSGIAFHMLPNNVYCILDWQRAVEAGIKTKSDVPAELRRRLWPDVDEEEEQEPPIPVKAPRPAAKAAGKSRR